MKQFVRKWSALVLVSSLVFGLLPSMAQAAVTWKNVGESLWLNAGSGLDLVNGGAGEDLVLTGTQVTSTGGMAIATGATALSSFLAVPSSDYKTSMDVASVENKVLVIKLADGSYAQVSIGMGWRSGMGFSSLQISGWMIGTEKQAEQPKPEPPKPEQPKPEPAKPEQPKPEQPKPEQPQPEQPQAPVGPVDTERIFWGHTPQQATLNAGRGLDLVTGEAGTHIEMTAEKITAPKGLGLMQVGQELSLSKITWATSMDIKQVEGQMLLVKISDARYARVSFGMGWRSGAGYSSIPVHWTQGIPVGLPESQLATAPYKPTQAAGTDLLSEIKPGLLDKLPSRSAIWTGTFAYVWTDGGAYRFDPATGSLTGMEFRNDVSYLDVAGSVWTGTYAYVVYATIGSGAYIVQYDPTTNKAEIKGTQLPTAYYSGAFWDGKYMYIIGARDTAKKDTDQDRNSLILRYDPATEGLTTMKAKLPAITGYGQPFFSTAWDGKHAYIFGADTGAIFRYDPAADTLSQMTATLPDKMQGSSAVYDGRQIYLVGGLRSDRQTSHWIYQYDPATDKITGMKSILPKRQMNGAVIWAGDAAYIFGGWESATGHASILRYATGNLNTSLTPERKAGAGGAVLAAVRKDGKAEITWPAFRTPNDGYYVFRGTASGKYDPTPLSDFPVLTGAFTDDTIKPGQDYYYMIKAYQGGEYTNSSVEVKLVDDKVGAANPGAPTAPGGSTTPVGPVAPNDPTKPLVCDLGTKVGSPVVVNLGFTPGGMHLRPDCTAWVFEQFSSKIYQVNLKTKQTAATITLPTSASRITAYSANPDLLYWVAEVGPVYIFDGATGKQNQKVDLPRDVWWDIPSPIGAEVDPATGRLIVYQNTGYWVVTPDGKATGPHAIKVGAGGITTAVVQGQTLWFVGLPTQDNPVVAVPLDLTTMKAGDAVTLLDAGALNSALGVTLAVAPDGKSFYVGSQSSGNVSIAIVRDGKVVARETLKDFRQTPLLKLSPDGALLALRDPGAARLEEGGPAFSVQGALRLMAADLSTVAAASGEVIDMGKVMQSDAGKPVFTLFSSDSRLLFIGNSVDQTITIYQLW